MPGYAKQILKKYREGGKVEEYKSDLMKEVEGMGPEGKRYLKDKLQGKKYEGELKDEFKDDLDKELRGMSEKGKEDLKKLLGLGDPFEKVREEINGKKKDKKSIGELMAYSEEGYAKGGKVEITPEAKKIPKELEKASKMHKGQADRLRGMGFKHGGEMEYAKGGEAKKRHKIDYHSLKGMTDEEFEKLPEDSPIREEYRNIAENFLDDEEEKNPALGTMARTVKQRRDAGGSWQRNVPDVGEDEKYVFGTTKKQRKALNKKFGHSGKDYRPDLLERKYEARKKLSKINKEYEDHRKAMKEGKYEKKNPLYSTEDRDNVKAERERVKKLADKYAKGGEANIDKYGPGPMDKKEKDWIQGAVKKPGALRAEAKKDKLIKGDEKLSAKDLSKLASKAKKGKNALLMRRVNLAKVFAKMRKKK